ncbi:ABC transporter permease [Arcanobacterium hippocoleae]
MWKMALRDIRTNFKRFLMTIFAVAIGVAFLTGTLAFRDLLSATFSNLTTAVVDAEGIQVSGPANNAAADAGMYAGSGNIDPAAAAKIAALDGVKSVQPQRMELVQTFTESGAATNLFGAPAMVFGTDFELEKAKIVSGNIAESGEILIEESTAARNGLKAGDNIIVYADKPLKKRISGIVKFGSAMAGASVVFIPEKDFIELFGAEYQSAFVNLEDGFEKASIKAKIARIVPDSYQVQTDTEVIAETQEQIEQILTIINTFLLTFVVLALGISTFIITNTFTILIRQRQRRLRCCVQLGLLGNKFLDTGFAGNRGRDYRLADWFALWSGTACFDSERT